MENQISEKESFELINQMINSAKKNFQKGMGPVFLLWGYLVAGTCLATLVLLLVLPPRIMHLAYYTWYIMPLGLIPHFFLVRRLIRSQPVRTYVDGIMRVVWIAFTASILILVTGMILTSLMAPLMQEASPAAYLNWIHWTFIVPFMLILYGFALFVSGQAYRFKPLIAGGVICWVSTLVIFIFLRTDYSMYLQLIVLIVSVTAGFIFPEHLLNIKDKSDVSGT